MLEILYPSFYRGENKSILKRQKLQQHSLVMIYKAHLFCSTSLVQKGKDYDKEKNNNPSK